MTDPAMATNGCPIQILDKNEETQIFDLNEDLLASVLLRDDVKDKPVCVVAVAGGPRKGKSFLLNYLLRYCANQGNSDWKMDPSEPLKGFDWAKSFQRVTTGISIWSEPFFVTLESGEHIAIVLMDTQGIFDTESSVEESTVIFALSLLTSSVLVYNLKENIHKDDFMHLETFMQYGRLACGGTGESKAFQKLVFLVRDWFHPNEFGFGPSGGSEFFKKIMKNISQQDLGHKTIIQQLRGCFSDIGCFLMPHPGPKAHQDGDFDGRLSDLSEEFVSNLKTLARHLVAPEYIEKKTVAGQAVKAQDLFNNFKSYVAVFSKRKLPEPITVAESIAKAFYEAGMREAAELYHKMMEMILQGRVLDSAELETKHLSSMENALENFGKKNPSMNKGMFEKCKNELKKELEGAFVLYKKQNEISGERKKAEEERDKAGKKLAESEHLKKQYKEKMLKSCAESSVPISVIEKAVASFAGPEEAAHIVQLLTTGSAPESCSVVQCDEQSKTTDEQNERKKSGTKLDKKVSKQRAEKTDKIEYLKKKHNNNTERGTSRSGRENNGTKRADTEE